LAAVLRGAGRVFERSWSKVGPTNEFSRRVVIEPWPEGGIAVELCAEPDERRALARRFGLLALHALTARGRVERVAGSRELRFEGWLEATLEQECVVSLEPVPASLREPVERRYLPGQAQAAPAGPAVLVADDDDEDEVELVSGRTIDVGEAIAEELALALDPYPRAPAAEELIAADLGDGVSFGAVAEPAEQPFAVLHRLEDKHAR
jgi:uncharacterized metal-binding protein YceD (DUF177 family)